MYVQVVNFNLKDTTEQEYRALCDQDAPVFGAMPGLIAKYWLADPETNTFGGVYLWESREALDEYLDGEVWVAVQADPHILTARRAHPTLSASSAATTRVRTRWKPSALRSVPPTSRSLALSQRPRRRDACPGRDRLRSSCHRRRVDGWEDHGGRTDRRRAEGP